MFIEHIMSFKYPDCWSIGGILSWNKLIWSERLLGYGPSCTSAENHRVVLDSGCAVVGAARQNGRFRFIRWFEGYQPTVGAFAAKRFRKSDLSMVTPGLKRRAEGRPGLTASGRRCTRDAMGTPKTGGSTINLVGWSFAIVGSRSKTSWPTWARRRLISRSTDIRIKTEDMNRATAGGLRDLSNLTINDRNGGVAVLNRIAA